MSFDLDPEDPPKPTESLDPGGTLPPLYPAELDDALHETVDREASETTYVEPIEQTAFESTEAPEFEPLELPQPADEFSDPLDDLPKSATPDLASASVDSLGEAPEQLDLFPLSATPNTESSTIDPSGYEPEQLGLFPISAVPLLTEVSMPEVSAAIVDPFRPVDQRWESNEASSPRSDTWFLDAGAFAAQVPPSPDKQALGFGKLKRHRAQKVAALVSGQRHRSAFVFLAVVLLAIVGGIAKLTVLDGGDLDRRADKLALTSDSGDCHEVAPARVVQRYEQQTMSETRRPAAVVRKTVIRFVDNETGSYLQRTDVGSDVSDMLVNGRWLVLGEGGDWTETTLGPSEIKAKIRLPFDDKYAKTKFLSQSTLDGRPVCIYGSKLGRVATSSGIVLKNAELELYISPHGTYRRIRVRGDLGSSDPQDSNAQAAPAEQGSTKSYVLTVDISKAPAFVPNPPTKLTSSF